MKSIVKVLIFLFMLASLNLTSIGSASAGCQDFPESVTPECVIENLAIAKLMQEAYEAAQIAATIRSEQVARENAARDEAERAAIIAADNALAPDDCRRSTNRWVQRCSDIEVERARLANEAIDAARRAATLAADNALAPDDCARSTNRYVQSCIEAATEKSRLESEARIAAERAATIAADNALAPDDCRRSTNRYAQRCSDIEVERARLANEAIDSIRKIAELENLQKIARDRYTANNCDDPANSSLQVCLDAALGSSAVKNANESLVTKINEYLPTLTEPLRNSDGEVIANVLLKSKTLDSKDILKSFSTRNISTVDKKLISDYAKKLNAIKGSQSVASIKIPVSSSLDEEFTSATPLVCKVVGKSIKTLKSGVCVLNITFATESGYEVATTKKFTIKR